VLSKIRRDPSPFTIIPLAEGVEVSSVFASVVCGGLSFMTVVGSVKPAIGLELKKKAKSAAVCFMMNSCSYFF
jgi:hypothetical protein